MTSKPQRNANEGRFLAFLGFLGSGQPQFAHLAGMALVSLLAVRREVPSPRREAP